MPISDDKKKYLDKMFADGKLFTRVQDTEEAPNLEPIWGNWLFRKCIVEEVGEPGLSKTSFNYTFILSLLNKQPFLGADGFHNVESNYILYCDLESADELIKSRRHLLDIPDHPNFYKFNLPGVYINELEPYLDTFVENCKAKGHSISIIFIDPIRAAFNTRDENDNSEASRQMTYVRTLAERWNCVIILVHHSSKAEMTGTRKGSGAFARPALADIIWNFEKLGEGFDPNLFKFYIPKSRYLQDDFCVCIRKNFGSFEAVDFPIGYSYYGTDMKSFILQEEIKAIMKISPDSWSPKDLEDALATRAIIKTKGIILNRMGIYRALTSLIQLGLIRKYNWGKYKYILGEIEENGTFHGAQV